MMATPIVWNGTQAEGQALERAIASNCTCQYGLMGVRTSTCPPHAAFANDQKFLDRLLCERRRRGELLKQEYMAKDQPK